MINAFSVDVEDYFQVSAFEQQFPRSSWESVPLRVDRGLERVLDVAERAGVRGTFYVLGWLAQKRPDLVRRIVERGHEIGCHSFEHRLIYTMTPDEFRNDLRRAMNVLQDAVGERCSLFRAPSFSITRASTWALRILAEEGIRVDSSVYPVVHDRYGIPGAPRTPFRPLGDQPDFVEFPPSTFQAFGMTLPCAGGGYLRLYPRFVTGIALEQMRRDGRPAMVYVHPWELDPDQPRVAAAGFVRCARHRVNLRKTAGRLERILGGGGFGTVSAAVAALGGARSLPVIDLESADASSSPQPAR